MQPSASDHRIHRPTAQDSLLCRVPLGEAADWPSSAGPILACTSASPLLPGSAPSPGRRCGHCGKPQPLGPLLRHELATQWPQPRTSCRGTMWPPWARRCTVGLCAAAAAFAACASAASADRGMAGWLVLCRLPGRPDWGPQGGGQVMVSCMEGGMLGRSIFQQRGMRGSTLVLGAWSPQAFGALALLVLHKPIAMRRSQGCHWNPAQQLPPPHDTCAPRPARRRRRPPPQDALPRRRPRQRGHRRGAAGRWVPLHLGHRQR